MIEKFDHAVIWFMVTKKEKIVFIMETEPHAKRRLRGASERIAKVEAMLKQCNALPAVRQFFPGADDHGLAAFVMSHGQPCNDVEVVHHSDYATLRCDCMTDRTTKPQYMVALPMIKAEAAVAVEASEPA